MKHCILFVLGISPQVLLAQSDCLDILSYTVDIELRDGADSISVLEKVVFVQTGLCDSLYLDLYQRDKDGKGMQLDPNFGVQQSGKAIPYLQSKNRLYFLPLTEDTTSITFRYSGIPVTGLIIGENKFSERTFFGDNWPNRAHYWIACIDHPSDKAQIRFIVKAPVRYHVVASGRETEADEGNNIAQEAGYSTHFFQTEYEIPTKVMVIGLAEFVFEEVNHPIPQRNYVYVNDSLAIRDLDVASSILDYYIDLIGPYPFEKMYHLQSTTQFGGMENAGNIFYDENAFTGKNQMEALIAHEIAHQWFGNSVSESDWPHLWLSEGFATYFTDLYIQSTYGEAAFRQRLKQERERVLNFYRQDPRPLVDSTHDIMSLLNPNSYQKGAWVLHMLRYQIGEDCFKEGVRTYYEQFKYSNVEGSDFFGIMEIVSGLDLSVFENQWMHQYGHPELSTTLSGKGSDYKLTIEQKQLNPFHFPLEIGITYLDRNGFEHYETQQINVNHKTELFPINLPQKSKLIALKIDPQIRLLYDGKAEILMK